MKKLDIGCGRYYGKRFDRLDFNKKFRPDILHDVNKIPWPIDDNVYDEIVCHHLIEHLPKLQPFLKEVYRISKNNCKFTFTLPHYSKPCTSPDHVRFYGLNLLSMNPKFKLSKKPRLEYTYIKGFRKIVTWLSNINPYVTETFFCYWLGGYANMRLEGNIDKSKTKDAWYRNDE